MRNRLLSLAMAVCMVLTLLPATVFAEETVETTSCICKVSCAEDAMNTDCPVCGAEGATLENCGKYEAPVEETEPEQTATEKVQAMLDALSTVEELKNADESTVNAAYAAAQDAYDALEALSPEEVKQIIDLEKLTALMDHFNGQISTTADTVTVSNETDLKNAFASVAGGTVKLGDNITISSTLAINGTVTLDLNGHTLTTTATRAIYISYGKVFTLKDSSSAGSGKITGGGVNNEGTFTMQSGTITGGTSNAGGGVRNRNIFIMDGGTISDCTSNVGGGVYNTDIFTMESGTISGCTATNSQGGGVYNGGGTFTMKGGTITGCTAKGQGGGGGVSNNTGTFDMRGGVISNCTANTTRGAGVYNKAILQNTSDAGATICYNALNHNTSDGGTISGKQVEFYNGDTLYAWEIVKDSGKASEPTAIQKTGYTFDGYTAKSGGNKFDFTTAITAKTTLYARWTPIPANAPTVSGSGAEVTYGRYTDKKISVTVTNQEGYTYSYQWYDSSENKIIGAIESTYTVPNNLTAGSHDYYCVVTAKRSDNGETASTKKKITVTVNKADQSAPTELVGTAETIDGKADGKITGVTSAMEYRKVGTTDYTAITGTEIIGLADGKYYVRYKADDNHNASTDEEVTIEKGRKLTVTVPTIQVGYTLTVNKTELVWNDNMELTFALSNGYSKLDTFAVNVNGNPITLDTNGKCTVNDIQSDIIITVAGVADITAPTGEITLGTNSWDTSLNNITFDLFFKDTQEVTITATDSGGEDVKIEYLLSDKELTVEELATATFTAYSDKFSIAPNNEYVIYAKLSDNSGNVAYVNSNGIVLDDIAPVISGLENGKTYCEAQTVTVSDKYDVTVTVNGTSVTLDANRQFTLTPASGTQTVVATDKAGNVSSEMAVTVNDGHTDTNKDHICDVETCKATISTCSGGTATCKDKAVCDYCGKPYGEVDSSNHALEHNKENVATVTATGNIEYWHCKDCDKYFSDKDGQNEINLKDTVIPKLHPQNIEGNGQSATVDNSTSPKTGDQSNMAFWFALLLISGGLLTGIGIYSKKKKDTV